jgi:hypothetical protein
MQLILLSLFINIIVLGLIFFNLSNKSFIDVWGKSSPSRNILFSVYLSIFIMSIILLFLYIKNKKSTFIKYMIVSLLLFHIDIDIIIFKDNLFAHNLLSENLMSNSRIMLTYNSYLILNKEKIVNTIDILIEPINLVIGFRQLRVFRGFYEKIDEFIQEITKSAITNEMQKMYRRKTKYTNKISLYYYRARPDG